MRHGAPVRSLENMSDALYSDKYEVEEDIPESDRPERSFFAIRSA